jgi:putative transposase
MGRFILAKIARILNEFDFGKSVDEISCEHGLSRAPFYKLRLGYGGMDATDLKRVKELEEENQKPKRVYANHAIELDTAKYIIT